MPFLAPIKSELDPIRLATAKLAWELRDDAREKARKQAIEIQKIKNKKLVDFTVKRLDGHRFRMAYSLGQPLPSDIREDIFDDMVLALAAEEKDNSPDRTRRHILIHGIGVLVHLAKGHPVKTAHVNGFQVAAELAMKLLPTYSMTAIEYAAKTLNRLWLDHGVPGATPEPPPRKTLSIPHKHPQ